ncbi:hypothetical protein [Brevibacillus brevis]|uniref:hypothetical protein n=1 Tax=Brevibacillus brevis TaxID=1393 RepID=UPI0011592669|nr:hypothetical protein C7Y45_03630 [Lysinibacillus sp. SDF0063]
MRIIVRNILKILLNKVSKSRFFHETSRIFLHPSPFSVVRLFWEDRKAVNKIGKFLATLYNRLSRALFFVW